MSHMFYVRSARAPGGPLAVGPSPCTPRRSRRPILPLLRLATCTSLCIVIPPLWTRQQASSFNKELSFDTSNVVEMGYMFNVRAPPACTRRPHLHQSRALSFARRSRRRRSPVLQYCFAAAPHPAPRAFLSTRQGAKSFSQPLSFKTSKVTDMSYMFDVRSARAPGGPHSCRLLARSSRRRRSPAHSITASHPAHLAPHDDEPFLWPRRRTRRPLTSR